MASALTPKTTLGTLFKEHPFLLSFLAGYHPELEQLADRAGRRTMGRFATLDKVAATAGVPSDKLLADLADEIENQTGQRPQVGATAAAGTDPARQEELKAIIADLHAGRSPEEVKPRFEALIKDVEAAEIAAMEQALMDEGLPDTEVKRLCDVHMQVFEDALAANPALCLPSGHPIDTFQRENRAVGQITSDMRDAADRAHRSLKTAAGEARESEGWPREKAALVASVERLVEFERHYLRKENQLFPFLERHGVEGPTKVMWSLHDDIRKAIKELRGALAADDSRAALLAVDEVTTMIDDMVNKEEKILLPMAFDVLSEEEWKDIRQGEEDVGYALVSNIPDWPAAHSTEEPPGAESPAAGPLRLHTGALSKQQLDLLIGALPLDLTFVDENDEVRFYSEGERIFPRSPGVIGRRVQNCHPPASVHKVQQIVDAFRAGEKDVADFWIAMNERFIHIRYFALRDAQGEYRGVVETVQDVTGIRALEGQRRLLDW